jgi:WYL domain-containing protein
MRINTGTQTVGQVNFTGQAHEERIWTSEEVALHLDIIGEYASAHTENAQDDDYLLTYGVPEVFEYELAGLKVTALLTGGRVNTVWYVQDDDIARYHTAARTGRTMKIRYAKPSLLVPGPVEISRREIEVQSVRLTKDGHVIVRALDRKADDTRSFRTDRITHTTLHRATAPARPTKAALAAAFQVHAASAAVTIPAPRPALEESAAWYLYDTTPGSPAALQAPESVQDKLAEAFALGRRYVKVYA